MSDGATVTGQERADTRCGFFALVGAPNAGKSTLVNALVGAKVSIVTHKVQTTRATVRGIAIRGASQMVLIDTPGIFNPRKRLEKAMVEAAWGGLADSDMALVLIDSKKGIGEDSAMILERVAASRRRAALVLTKVDLVTPERLLPLAKAANEAAAFERTFMVSAETGSGIDDLLDYLAETSPPGPWHFPEDDISDAPLRSLAAEVTREKLFLRVHDEIPYQTTIETTLWKDIGPDRVRIEQTIYVARDRQKAIVLGHKGETVKAISMSAREELTAMLDKRVDLFLFVKVSPNWVNDPERYREMGLDRPSE
ncbi:MAG: GTPase Era [Flavobacteriaceae bacterium]